MSGYPRMLRHEDGERGGAEKQQHLPGGPGGRTRGLPGMSLGILLQQKVRQIEKGQEHQNNPQAEGEEARARHPERPERHLEGKGSRTHSAEKENNPLDQLSSFHHGLLPYSPRNGPAYSSPSLDQSFPNVRFGSHKAKSGQKTTNTTTTTTDNISSQPSLTKSQSVHLNIVQTI